MTRTHALLAPVFAITLAACGPAGPEGFAPAPVVLPGPAGAPPPSASDAPKPLPGVDIDKLVERERKVWWGLVAQLYAPCAEQAVSIAQCVDEKRPCAACRPAAQLLASKVHGGATPEEARQAYAVRFGPNVKQVDLKGSPSQGPADAPVTLVVWSDFECPHCRMAMPFLERAMKKFEGRVRLVHKFYPLHSHTFAEGSARAAIAAMNQGRYWEMERLLFAHQDVQTPADLDKYAAELQLDPKRFHDDQGAGATTQLLKRDRDEADKAGLTGTPFILVNGREFDMTYFHLDEELEPWIALELELLGKGAAK